MATNNSINGATKITTYIASDTWTKDPRSQYIEVYMWGSGGAGGSGRRGASAASGGGSGGAPGDVMFISAPASVFGSTQTVTIGGTVTGASGQTSDNTNGLAVAGSVPFSLFGTYTTNQALNANGPGGINGSASIGSSGIFTSKFSGSGIAGPVAGGGGNANGGTPATLNSQSPFATGGGGASGANSVTPQQAARGGNLALSTNTSTIILTGGAGGIESGTINGSQGTIPNTTSANGYLSGGAGGGGGGGQSTGLVAGNGAAGRTPAGGGGGGGGSLNTFTSGSGGDGARGQVIVIEFLS